MHLGQWTVSRGRGEGGIHSLSDLGTLTEVVALIPSETGEDRDVSHSSN
jgi:hypothetical protein